MVAKPFVKQPTSSLKKS